MSFLNLNEDYPIASNLTQGNQTAGIAHVNEVPQAPVYHELTPVKLDQHQDQSDCNGLLYHAEGEGGANYFPNDRDSTKIDSIPISSAFHNRFDYTYGFPDYNRNSVTADHKWIPSEFEKNPYLVRNDNLNVSNTQFGWLNCRNELDLSAAPEADYKEIMMINNSTIEKTSFHNDEKERDKAENIMACWDDYNMKHVDQIMYEELYDEDEERKRTEEKIHYWFQNHAPKKLENETFETYLNNFYNNKWLSKIHYDALVKILSENHELRHQRMTSYDATLEMNDLLSKNGNDILGEFDEESQEEDHPTDRLFREEHFVEEGESQDETSDPIAN
ncbi:unnamed protein product [Caenorhabditis bovis]|uniref:Uncharacterized protein n=1 Tax=Caenorhabditis bovis TaxID=2654633 RepID=A0A8S1EJB0_9PELO|nr:unnamed protein product [Caenorhabditis bovis]